MSVRNILVSFLCAIMFSVTAFAQNRGARYNELIRPPQETSFHVPIGLCEDYPEETTTLEIIRKDMELLKRAGIDVLRISFGWDGIELERDKFHWGFWDDYVRIATEEYGITLIPYICYTPPWNSTGDTTNYWNHTPKDYEHYGVFVKALVNRYKNRIKSWELWNEPDIREYWSGNSADMARLIKIGATAVREADPAAIIVCPGLAGHTDFTLRLFRDHGISSYVDVVNLHSYFETWSGDPAEQVVPYINTIAGIIRQYGNNQSIWMAEVGYSTFRRADGYVSDSYRAYYGYEHTPAYQAVHLFRTITMILSTNVMAAIAWYEIKDLPPGENVIGDVNNRNLGVASVDFQPKPAQTALSFANTLFGMKNRCIDDRVAVKRTLGSESELHCFENADGSVIVVGWLRTNTPGKRTADKSGKLTDTRKESVSITLPGLFKSRATRYTELGAASSYTAVKAGGGTTTLPDVQLDGGGMFIAKLVK